MTAAICDLMTATCNVIPDWSNGTVNATDSGNGAFGYDVICPTAHTCVARTPSDVVFFLEVSELTIEAYKMVDIFANVPTKQTAMINLAALSPGSLYIARDTMFATPLSRDDVFWEFTENSTAPFNDTVVTGGSYGVLLYDIGKTWVAPPTGACKYADLQAKTGLNITGTEVCGFRADCEEACSEAGSACVAFDYEAKSGLCHLYSTCTDGDKAPGDFPFVTVKKVDSVGCTVSVTDADVDAPGYDRKRSANGVYHDKSSTEFRTASNGTRIVFDVESWASRGCLGWSLEQNQEAMEKVSVVTFKNADESVLNVYRPVFEATPAKTNATNPPMPGCSQLLAPPTGTPAAWSCDDLVLKDLCGATCKTLVTGVVADNEMTYHYIGDVDDSDIAAMDYSGSDCSSHAGTDCDAVLAWICPAACGGKSKPFHEVKVDFLLGDDSASWAPLVKTYANGSDVVHTTDAAMIEKVYGYQQCVTVGPIGNRDLLEGKVYRAVPAVAQDIEMQNVCAKDAKCPTTTTCVQIEHLFVTELSGLRSSLSEKIAGRVDMTDILDSAAWVDFSAVPDVTSDDAEFKFPKVLTSAERAEAVIRTSLWDYGKEIFRSAPGATRVRIAKVAPSTTTVFASLSRAIEHRAVSNFGRSYAVPKGYDSWITDVIRIEAFAGRHADAAVISGSAPFVIEIFIPGITSAYGPKIFAFYGDDEGKDVTTIPGASLAPTPNAHIGWYSLTVPADFANGDFVATTDVDECKSANACEPSEIGGGCQNTDGAYVCMCMCEKGGTCYKPDNGVASNIPFDPAGGVKCILDKYQRPDQMFVLYHNDDAEYGLHVKEIRLFESADDEGRCMGLCKNKRMGYDCHYGQEVGDRNDAAHKYIKNLRVSGSYPGYPHTGLVDNAEGQWWPDKMALSRTAGTGAWVSFEVAGETVVNCVRVELDCGRGMPKSFSLFRSKVGAMTTEPAVLNSAGPFPGFIEKVMNTAADGTVDLAVPCGIKDAQYFGETFTDYKLVETPCECKQLCVDHVDRGCAMWKWYGETQHCFLLRDVFEGDDAASELLPSGALGTARAAKRSLFTSGSGWWKRKFARGWPGWVTGETGPLPVEFSTLPAVVVLDEPFDVTVKGQGFPVEEAMADDLGARQRIKVVANNANCVTEMPPDSVEGVDCTNWFTCSPRPESYTRTSATWKGMKIAAQKEKMEYKVCYCWGQCWIRENWAEVPGSIKAVASAYSWGFESLTAPSKRDAFEGITVRVSRPAFSSLAPTADWKLKLVKDIFDCETLAAAEVCDGTHCGAATEDFGPDEALFVITASADVASGDYHVCFSEDGGEYAPIPSATARYLTIKSLASDAEHPIGPFHHQILSGRSGTTSHVKLSGFGMSVPNQASLAIVDADDCYLGNTPLAILTADGGSATEALFSGDIPEISGSYRVCACDPDTWINSHAEARPSDWSEESGAAYYYDAADLTPYVIDVGDPSYDAAYGKVAGTFTAGNSPLTPAVRAHLCVSKCAAGCVGSSCFCDGLLASDAADFGTADSGPLCLSAERCRMACTELSQTGDCTGYSMMQGNNRCFLSKSGGSVTDLTYDLWQVKAVKSTPCRAPADFFALNGGLAWQKAMEVKKNVGVITITKKADIGAEFVATPGQVTSLEITGTNLSFFKDRIMVIDCSGTCGIAKPSPFVKFGDMDPVSAFVDRPSLNDLPDVMAVPTAALSTYHKKANQYCPGTLMAKPETAQAGHLCYRKCSSSCTDESCFCDGYMHGYDNEDSEALCLDLEQCQWLCDLTPGCHSIDMHNTLPRCYMNTMECADAVQGQTTIADAQYSIYVSGTASDDNSRRLGRQLTAAQVRKLLAAEDPGISWGDILRFKDITFTSAGEFKLCFCDSDLASGKMCHEPADYSVEIGKIHATGLQCLLSNPKMTRGQCVSQHYGGLRCYDGDVPDVQVPIEYLGVPRPTGHTWGALTKQLMQFCQYAPLEDIKPFPFCEQWRAPLIVAADGTPAKP
jgi:hypothetical protein